MTALLASPWGAYAAGALALAAVWAGATLGATWDRATTAIRHYYAPGSRRR
jgi:hypothetical protein